MVALAAAKESNDAAELTGKHALVVGGTSGCGLGVALVLARRGCSVTVIGRNQERGEAALQALHATGGSGTYEFVSLNVLLLRHVAEFCASFRKAHSSLDFLSLSCTRGGIQSYRPTAEGYDERLVTMYLARFAFVHQLLPLLLEAEDPRVLSILSAGKHKAHKGWASDFETKRLGMAGRTYAAGWYGDCAGTALAKAHPKLTIVHAYPGFVNTNWWRELPWGLRLTCKALMRAAGKPFQAAGEWMAYPLIGAAPRFQSGFHSMNEHAESECGCAETTEATADAVWAKTIQVYEALGA